MEVSKRRLFKQLLQSDAFGGSVVDNEATRLLLQMGLICWRNKLEYSTMLTGKGKRLLRELEATWENQT